MVFLLVLGMNYYEIKLIVKILFYVQNFILYYFFFSEIYDNILVKVLVYFFEKKIKFFEEESYGFIEFFFF